MKKLLIIGTKGLIFFTVACEILSDADNQQTVQTGGADAITFDRKV